MVEDTSTNIAGVEQVQDSLNAERWRHGDFVDRYASRELRAVEQVLLSRWRRDLEGRVLELGCGAGRLTGHLTELSDEVHAIDISPRMIAYCRRIYPRATFAVGDLRELGGFHSGDFDTVVASFNVLDVLGDEARREVLAEIRRLLRPRGLLIMSSHNLAYASRFRTTLRLWLRLLIGTPRRPKESLRNLPRRWQNRSRLRPKQRHESHYAILNDEAHDFSVLHYYVSRDAQERQMKEAGYALIECRDLEGRIVEPGDTAPHAPELHYVARR
jgi:SAM-dependent methyltransferase